MTTSSNQICEGCIIVGSLFNEPMRVETVRVGGDGTRTVGLVGTQSERFRKVTLTASDIHSLTILDFDFSYDGDGRLLRLGLQAYSLGIAYEFDPYFGLSISRVDPLPHPEREAPDVKQLRQNLETEATAMRVVMEHEEAQDRKVYDVHEKNLGYDITSLDLNSGDLRLIEVKGLGADSRARTSSRCACFISFTQPSRFARHCLANWDSLYLYGNRFARRCLENCRQCLRGPSHDRQRPAFLSPGQHMCACSP